MGLLEVTLPSNLFPTVTLFYRLKHSGNYMYLMI
jgi:hypothetical protein